MVAHVLQTEEPYRPNIQGHFHRPKPAISTLDNFSAEVIRDLNWLFRQEHKVEQALTAIRQKQTAQFIQRNKARSLEGLGRHRLEVDDYSRHYWGQREGYDCWFDKQFLREFERDNEAARVRCGGTRTQVGWTPPAQPRGLTLIEPTGCRRFRKHYVNSGS